MAASDLVDLSGLMDDAKCFAFVRQRRWPDGVRCPGCGGDAVIRDGHDDMQPHRQRYRCRACASRFDDLTGTALAGRHRPLRVWVLCLYFMGLNLSNRQIALELGLSPSDAQAMTERLRRGLVAKAPDVELEGEVEIDEVYVVAGHKGQPAAVAKGGGSGDGAGWKARRDAARRRRTGRPSSA
jgi:transposase-like protein